MTVMLLCQSFLRRAVQVRYSSVILLRRCSLELNPVRQYRLDYWICVWRCYNQCSDENAVEPSLSQSCSAASCLYCLADSVNFYCCNQSNSNLQSQCSSENRNASNCWNQVKHKLRVH